MRVSEAGEGRKWIKPVVLPAIVFCPHIPDLGSVEAVVASHGLKDEDLEVRIEVRNKLILEPILLAGMKRVGARSATCQAACTEDDCQPSSLFIRLSLFPVAGFFVAQR